MEPRGRRIRLWGVAPVLGAGAGGADEGGAGMAGRRNWRAAARCGTTDAEGLFVTGARQREARSFCRVCPVRTECLAHALDQRIEFGVWGGMTERERRGARRGGGGGAARAGGGGRVGGGRAGPLAARPARPRPNAARHGRAAATPDGMSRDGI